MNYAVKDAAKEFACGNFSLALEIYKELEKKIGKNIFSANIRLCERRIFRESNSILVNSRVHAELAKKPEELIIEKKCIILKGNSKFDIVSAVEVPYPGAVLSLSTAVTYRVKNGATTGKAALLFSFFDDADEKIKNIQGLGISGMFQMHFRYLNASAANSQKEVLPLPENVRKITISLASFGIEEADEIEISLQGSCCDKERERDRSREILLKKPFPEVITHDKKNIRYISELIVASILDEFTTECLSHELKLIKLLPDLWERQLDENPPDFLLIESCWKGNDGAWGTLTKGSGASKKLSSLLRYCKAHSIPTVFWNKEDPPHYEKFAPIAAFFDLVITTDVNMVPRYKEDFGVTAYPLSFAAQPRIHNPSALIPRKNRAVFAGSYYGDKPKRCEDFNEVMSQIDLANIGYDIFDRNYGKQIEKFRFPLRYQSHIVGNLSAEEVWKAHKGYKYQVNMNSVQNSATMFARRVYESLASGTPVISNDSLGVRELFGDIVIMPGLISIAEQLRTLEDSTSDYDELARKGVRAVMREHTYGHRIKEICRQLGIDVQISLPRIKMVVTARSEWEIARARELFNLQTAKCKELFIELENFKSAYRFLNESDETVTYAMKLGRQFYADTQKYYGDDRIFHHDVNQPLAANAMEDFIYWGNDSTSMDQLQTKLNIKAVA